MTKPQQHPTSPRPDSVGPPDDDATIPNLTPPAQQPLPDRKRRHQNPPAPQTEESPH